MTEQDTFDALKYRTYDAVAEAYCWHNEAGLLHRENGPAIERADGSMEWYINGKLHRVDGPAVEYADGSKMWWLNDIPMSKKEFDKAIKCNSARQNISTPA